MTSSIRYRIDADRIAYLTLNRPAVRNALSWEMMEAFSLTVDQIKAEDVARVLIIDAEGQRSAPGAIFSNCTTYDSQTDGARLATMMGDALEALSCLPIPVIAAIEGPAIGGGAEIALACDLRVLARGAQIGLPQIRLALTPAWGGARRLMGLLGYARAFELLSTGRLIESQEAFSLGLAQLVVADGEALPAAADLAQVWLTRDPAALRALKSLLLHDPSRSSSEGTSIERSVFAKLWAADAHASAASDAIQHKR